VQANPPAVSSDFNSVTVAVILDVNSIADTLIAFQIRNVLAINSRSSYYVPLDEAKNRGQQARLWRQSRCNSLFNALDSLQRQAQIEAFES
jgi:hypothetical protein